MFYNVLRGYGFRAHVARNIYEYALALVKSVRESNGSKPTLRKLSARLDYQDARVELDKGIVRIVLRNQWHTLKLKHRREYIEVQEPQVERGSCKVCEWKAVCEHSL
jgi:putative transposase